MASRAFGFTKNQAKFVTIDEVETRFDDVAGVPEAAEELKAVSYTHLTLPTIYSV